MARSAAHPVESLLLNRWSPRAMDGRPLSNEDLRSVLEGARWAPSGGNLQPWRIAYSIAGTPSFPGFVDLLVEANRVWAGKAGALLVIATDTLRGPGKPSPTAPFDTGAAWMGLALQASARGLVAHGMGGFDYVRAHALIGASDTIAVQCMVALGYPGKVDELPEPLRARESPSDRKPQDEWAFEGKLRLPQV